jgi:hypothetical protein
MEEFVKAAIDHGKYTMSGNSRLCNRAYDKIIQSLRVFRKLSDEGKSTLAALIAHPDDSVKTWASTYLLPLEEKVALSVLESVASRSGLIAFDARMVIKEWSAGRLKLI